MLPWLNVATAKQSRAKQASTMSMHHPAWLKTAVIFPHHVPKCAIPTDQFRRVIPNYDARMQKIEWAKHLYVTGIKDDGTWQVRMRPEEVSDELIKTWHDKIKPVTHQSRALYFASWIAGNRVICNISEDYSFLVWIAHAFLPYYGINNGPGIEQLKIYAYL